MMSTNRCLMAELIAEYGPMQGNDIRGSLHWSLGQIHESVFGNPDQWFVMTVNGWNLTEYGRDQFTESLRLHPRLPN